MIFYAAFVLSSTAIAAAIASQCSVTFDGRIPQNATKSLFTSSQSPYNPKYVLGQNVTWDQVISFPNIDAPLFDAAVNAKPIELEITDRSIFASSSEGAETALRRAELLVNSKPSTVSGNVTWFLSLRSSASRPLNLSHEYLLAFHEAQDYQADFWSLKVGVPLEGPQGYGDVVGFKDERVTDEMLKKGEVIYLQGYKWAVPMQTFFMAPFTPSIWHNFGLYLSYSTNELQVLYSTGHSMLEIVTPLVPNNLSGKAPTTLGETHIGLQKKPTGANLTNFLFEGEQEWGIRESLMLGGTWQIGGHPKDCGIL